jgi:hypothetical protein
MARNLAGVIVLWAATAACGSGDERAADDPDGGARADAGTGQSAVDARPAAPDAPPAGVCAGGGGPRTFTCTGSLGTPRVAPGIGALPDGRALVAGGWNPATGALSSAELYDPASGTFAPTGSMAASHLWAGWAEPWPLLANGKLLVAGGLDAAGALVGGAELYDPATGSFAATGALLTPVVSFAPVMLADGSVLFAGGYDSVIVRPPTPGWLYNSAGSSQAQRYDPATGSFAPAGALGGGHLFGCHVRLASGQVLAIGGWRGVPAAFETTVERYDPETNGWTPVGTLGGGAPCGAAAYLLADGKVLLGLGPLYDPTSGAITPTAGAPAGAWLPTFARLPSGEILAAGGLLDGTATNIAAVYDPAANAWSPVGSLHFARGNDARAVVLGNGQVLVAGGSNAQGPVSIAEIYHP